MLNISEERKELLIRELCSELNGRLDGGHKNIVVPVCPFCGKKGGRFGIYVGPAEEKLFWAHCFRCGYTQKNPNKLFKDIGRPDLEIKEVASLELETEDEDEIDFMDDEEPETELEEVEMPKGWKRTFKNKYLKKRGFLMELYDKFPVGTTRGLNWQYDDYVIFQIIMNGKCVGYIGRNVMSKEEIDEHNERSRYQIRRYLNSTENDFSRLLFNYDSIIPGETRCVILTEGIFDTMRLVKMFELYDNPMIVPIATFGKSISEEQMELLQKRGITQVVVAYDMDDVGKKAITKTMAVLDPYFDVLALTLQTDGAKDIDECSWWELYDSFSYGLLEQAEFNLNC